MRSRVSLVMLMVFLLLGTPLSGCFGSGDAGSPTENDLEMNGVLTAGDWSKVTLVAKRDLSVYIPYFVVDPGSNRAQNGTVLDIKSGTSETVDWLLPPRNPNAMVMIGDYGRTNWPVRAANESWQDWIADPSNGGAVKVTENGDNGTWNWLTADDSDGGLLPAIKSFDTIRPQRSDLTMDDGVDASGGWVDGRSVYEWVEFMTDETPCSDVITCGTDGAVGYLDRWVGNQNPSYEEAIDYFEGVMTGFGLRAEVHRYWTGTVWAANVCGYKDGTTFPNEWLVFGGHFDIAPYATPTSLLPGLDETGYGTRTGAYDNSAGSAMVLTTAGALADFDARRTMVFCLWSSEEEGLWGSRAFAGDIPSGVTVSNYLNLDMAGVNYPGDYALSVYLGPDGTGDVVDQPGMFHLAEWIGADALDLAYQMERGAAEWAAGGESPLWQIEYEDTVAIYESPTARSDHDSFQEIGVATLGWNGVVDGFPCYHKTCDKLETLEEYMVTENATGVANLAHSWDIVTWWAVFAFLHMDQTPVPNEL
ncbi:MAG: M28 family peptidase [Candidatus Thermoplasmatota archaeon]|nr:M28 family peptidase [Candidatus Thermoplasmatota archaeon]